MSAEPAHLADALAEADAHAERLTAALIWLSGGGIEGDNDAHAHVTRDARNYRPLAAAASSLALVSMARDVRRAVDMAAQFYFDDEED